MPRETFRPTPVPGDLLAMGLRDAVREFERAYFLRLARETDVNLTAMADRAGMARHESVRQKLLALGLWPRATLETKLGGS